MRPWFFSLVVMAIGCGAEPSTQLGNPYGATSNEELLQLPDVVRPAPTAAQMRAVTAERRPPPIQGGTLVALAASTVAISDPDRDALYFVDVENPEAAARTATLPDGSEPTRIVAGTNGRAHVVLRGAQQVVTLDVASAQVLATYDACELPRGLAFSATVNRLYVACAGGELVQLDETGSSELARVRLQRDLRDVVATPEGLRVSTFRSAEVIYLDTEMTVLNQVQALPGSRPNIFDTSQVQTMSPGSAWRMVGAQAGEDTFLLHQRAQDDPLRVAYYGVSCQAGIVEHTVSVFNAQGDTVARAALNGASLPVDLSPSPDRQWLAVASPGNFVAQSVGLSQLLLVSVAELESSVGQLELNPATCIGLPQPEHVFPGELTSVQFLSETRLLGFVRQPASLYVMAFDSLLGRASLERIVDLNPRDVSDSGHLLFHQAQRGGLSCASCHPFGGDDGHVWQFSDLGARRTQTLLGGVMQRAPFHWNGELLDFSALMVETLQNRMQAIVPRADVEATLSSWLDGLPSERLAPTDPAAVQRGAAWFFSETVACASCHLVGDYSSSKLYDVGTNPDFQLKAPTLLGISLRSPLMHNGCAATLRDRFDPACGGTAHGNVAHLTEAELGDLIAFVDSL
jgi:hypothetical protein